MTADDTTDHDTTIGHDDLGIIAAIDAAEATLPAAPAGEVLDTARHARDRHITRRRRNVRVVIGSAAALVLLVAGVAIAVTRNNSGTTYVASESSNDTGSAADSSSDPMTPVVVVEPDSGLVDGQEVLISVVRGSFDPGTPISAMQCVSSPMASLTCDTRTRTSLGPAPSDDEAIAGPMTLYTELDALAMYHLDEATASYVQDPAAGSPAPASCTDDTTTANLSTPGESGVEPVAPDPSAVAPTTMPDNGPDVDTPCMIVVFGVTGLTPQTIPVAITFGEGGIEPGSTPPGLPSDDDSVASPVQPQNPDDMPSRSNRDLPLPAGCPQEPEYFSFSGDTGPSGPLLAFVPNTIDVCTYGVGGTTSGLTLTSKTDIEPIVEALNALEAPRRDQVCTDEMGPSAALVARDGSRTETVWLEFYGCGTVHNGAMVRTGARTVPLPVE